MNDNHPILLGIDLGTTYSAMAYIDEYGDAKIISNSDNERITPSVVFFESPDNIIVGQNAKDETELTPEMVISFVKREMGKHKSQVRIEQLSDDLYSMPKPYTFFGKTYAPETISSIILKKLKNDAEKYFNGREINEAVITVPAYFNEAEKKATQDAGVQAGFKVLQVISEPTAAAISYGLETSRKNEKVFVFDLGGGTFDVTILDIIGHGDNKVMNIIDTDGDHHLGGKDWDDTIIQYACDLYAQKYSDAPRNDLEGFADLVIKAERMKKQLTEKEHARFNMNCNGNKLKVELTRAQFRDLAEDLMLNLENTCELVLDRNGIKWSDIDTILLVGGSTRMPMVREMLEHIAQREISDNLVQPDECVALGAAMRAMMLKLGNKADTSLYSKELLSKYHDGLTVNDILSKSIGIVAQRVDEGRKMAFIFNRQLHIPASKSQQFFTIVEGQTSVKLSVREGESKNPDNCRVLVEKDLVFNRPMPIQSPIEVTFSMDHSGLLNVKAIDLTDFREIEFEVERRDNMSKAEVQNATALVSLLNVE
jgi:molecular chaperone DnaK